MHNGMVQLDNEKMSKSLGNFFTIREVLSKYKPETVRFFLVRAHYRSDLNYSNVHLDDAENSLKRLYTALNVTHGLDAEPTEAIDWSDPFATRFKAAMDDDFGTPGAVSVLFDLAAEVNRTQSAAAAQLLKKLGGCLGLLQQDATAFLQQRADSNAAEADQASQNSINQLVAQRNQAKLAKDFAQADKIRQQLLAQGIVLKDSASGTTWEAK